MLVNLCPHALAFSDSSLVPRWRCLIRGQQGVITQCQTRDYRGCDIYRDRAVADYDELRHAREVAEAEAKMLREKLARVGTWATTLRNTPPLYPMTLSVYVDDLLAILGEEGSDV